MKTVFKRLLIVFGGLLLLLFVALFAITSFFEEEIGERVTTELNAQLKSELRIDGFSLSFLRTFPNIGANLQGVTLNGTDDKRLLTAEELSFQASLFSLFGSNIKLQSVVVRKGKLNIHTDGQGRNNYDIFLAEDMAANTDTEETNNSAIALKQASIIDMQLQYRDEVAKQDINLFVEDATFTGQFASDEYQLTSEAVVQILYLMSNGEQFLGRQTLHYETSLDVDGKSDTYTVDQLDLQLGELPLSSSGAFQLLADKTVLDLKLTSDGGQLSDLLHLLPSGYKAGLAGIETKGDFALTATVKGEQSEKRMPQIDARIDFSDGRISGDRVDARVRDLGFVATYTNGERQTESTSSLQIENFQGEIEGEPFALDLSIADFNDPKIDFTANGTLAPGLLMGFIPDERITEGSGTIKLSGIQLKGRYNDMLSTSRIGRVTMNGQIDFDEASLTINDEQVRLSSGQLSMNDNALQVQNVIFEGPGTNIRFAGQATNLLPVLFADSLNSKQASMEFEALLEANELDIDELLALGAPSKEVQKEAEAAGKSDSLAVAEVSKRAFFTQFLDGTFQAEIKEFNYGEIEGEDFRGSLDFADGIMTIKGNTRTMEGEIILDGKMKFDEKPTLNAKLSCIKVSAYEFFRQAENFGQDVLVADNIEGQLDARIYLEAAFDEEGNFLANELRVLGGLGLKDGRLKDFKMLEDFSAFVNIRDLQEIRFTNLENFFEVRDQKLFLPVMFIQSNALNLTISGEHSFDQNISYYLKVNAGQVMSDRFRRHNPRLRPKPARKNGFFNLYYAILGDIDNFNFTSDKRRVTNDFQESERRKRDIHYALERKFGTVIELVQEPVDWRDIPEHHEDPDSDEPEFLDMEIDGGGR